MLFLNYIEKLEALMSLYNVETPYFIIIPIREILEVYTIKRCKKSKINLSINLINKG